MRPVSILAGLAFATLALAQSAPVISSFCTNDLNDRKICGAISVPTTGQDTYFQVNSSASAGWSAIGVGSGMAGALIFVVYPSADGQNVTVSPRLGRGHVEPLYDSGVSIQVLDGSSVSGDALSVNFKCSNCRSWSGGSLDVASTNQNFIWATGPGMSIKSNSFNQEISQHSSMGNFAMDISRAKTGSDGVNPFTSRAAVAATGSTPSGTGGTAVQTPQSKADRVLIAHGVIMALTWLILFPLGAAFIRLLDNHIPNAFMMHRGLQLFAVCLAIIGMSLGIWVSGLEGTHFTTFHQYFGVILVGTLFVQGALGQLHHMEFRATGKRSFWSYGHIWFGRTVIVLGIINGGIGLAPYMANASRGQVVAYSVVAVLVVGTYVLFFVLKQRKKNGGVHRRV